MKIFSNLIILGVILFISCENTVNNPVPAPVPVPEFIKIEGGTFTMGIPESSPYWRKKYEYEHEVTVSTFYMSKYEITQNEFRAVMGFNPHGYWAPELPVDFVSWYDAIDYCNGLSILEGLNPAYTLNGTEVVWDKNANGYRLPTEAEWEYACRAGTKTDRYFTGDEVLYFMKANYNPGGPSYDGVTYYLERMTIGGSYPPNSWGLYDMLGNVFEWCWDWWEDDYYKVSPKIDPSGPDSGNRRTLRGGCYFLTLDWMHSGRRDWSPAEVRWKGDGIRLVHNYVE